MPYGLYISAEGAQAQSLRMEVIANNIANTNTPAFKRELSIFQSRLAEAAQRGLVPPGMGAIDDLGGGVESLATITDFTSGAMKSTETKTDMAIEGDGFFVVRRQGKDLLTRAGNFMLTPAGMLVTQNGDPVIATDGNPVTIDPQRGPWDVTPDGAVSQAGEKNYLALVRPRSYGDLMKTEGNLFAPLAPTVPVPATERSVMNRYLEQSGAEPVSEMTDMIETSRAFEANVNMIRSQDTILGELVSRVLKTG